MLSTSYMGETGNWNNGKSNGLYHLVWDKLLKILSVSLSSWGGGASLCLRYFHGSEAITRSEQQSSNPNLHATLPQKKLQHPPFNSSSYTSEWAVSGGNTFFLHFLVCPVYLDIPVHCGFYYLNSFVQVVSTLDFLKFPVIFNKATHIYLCIQALINLF